MHTTSPMVSASRTTAASLVALILSIIPSLMLGGVAVLVRADLGFSESLLGVAISTFYAVSAIASVAGGRLSERLGGTRALRVGVVISTVSLLGVAGLTRSWIHLVGWLAVGGLANAILQPATNLAIARGVPRRRQALALGVKQTNGPLGTLIAGVSAPLIGLTLGWRWAFAAAALLTIVFFVILPRAGETPPSAPRAPVPSVPRGALLLIAAGAGFGVAAAIALVGFYMESAVALGHSIARAGAFLAIGSAAGAVARIGWGWLADHRRSNGATLITAMLCVGSLAFGALAYSGHPAVLLVVTIAVFVTGWGWVGLLHLVVIHLVPDAPGNASGVVNVGVSIGGIVGPASFGLIVEHVGYPTAWATTAAALVAGALLIRAGARPRLLAGHPRPSPIDPTPATDRPHHEHRSRRGS